VSSAEESASDVQSVYDLQDANRKLTTGRKSRNIARPKQVRAKSIVGVKKFTKDSAVKSQRRTGKSKGMLRNESLVRQPPDTPAIVLPPTSLSRRVGAIVFDRQRKKTFLKNNHP
jgi:hypothetical protein